MKKFLLALLICLMVNISISQASQVAVFDSTARSLYSRIAGFALIKSHITLSDLQRNSSLDVGELEVSVFRYNFIDNDDAGVCALYVNSSDTIEGINIYYEVNDNERENRLTGKFLNAVFKALELDDEEIERFWNSLDDLGITNVWCDSAQKRFSVQIREDEDNYRIITILASDIRN